ncbi:MAG TPA: hypothetical protein VF761_07355 [Gemmatimonadaceae bacterium]
MTHVLALLALLALAPDSTTPPKPIQDNSFLIEEAYNQEHRVVQHINTFMRATTGRGWTYSFTQEWPAPSRRHQLSYTIPVLQLEEMGPARRAVGDVAINYRYQLRGMHDERVASAPRLSLLLPTGSVAKGAGAGGTGIQINLPLSVELSDRLVTHLNAGATLTPRARIAGSDPMRTASWNAGESFIWLLGRRLNAMLEASWSNVQRIEGPRTTVRESQFLLSPGVRWSYDLASGMQIVPGVAVPIGVGPSSGSRWLFLYFSVEHPF